MRTAPDPQRPLHRKALAVLEEVRSLLEGYGNMKSTGGIRLEINIHHGVPIRLTRLEETRRDIPLEERQ